MLHLRGYETIESSKKKVPKKLEVFTVRVSTLSGITNRNQFGRENSTYIIFANEDDSVSDLQSMSSMVVVISIVFCSFIIHKFNKCNTFILSFLLQWIPRKHIRDTGPKKIYQIRQDVWQVCYIFTVVLLRAYSHCMYVHTITGPLIWCGKKRNCAEKNGNCAGKKTKLYGKKGKLCGKLCDVSNG